MFSVWDDAWVQREGVPGKPAPSGFNKWPLHTAKVCQALGIPMPADMPHGDVKVGKHCPACAERGKIPEGNWFYRPSDPEFVANGSRIRDMSKANCAWAHKHTTCTFLWMKLHIHVKANPSDMHLFDPLPEGQDPSII